MEECFTRLPIPAEGTYMLDPLYIFPVVKSMTQVNKYFPVTVRVKMLRLRVY